VQVSFGGGNSSVGSVFRCVNRFAVGQQIGAYRIEALLGSGGMGTVYLAYDDELGRRVAIKVVDSKRSDPESSRSLLDEARTAAALNHPSICSVHGLGRIGSEPFIVMEHVVGRPLSSMIPDGTGLPPESAIHYGMQIADALAHAHAHGVVHGDIKSANVMVALDGRAKILDFGLAVRPVKVTVTGDAPTTQGRQVAAPCAGTVAYMAPELLRGWAPSVWSDLWAFGVLFYEMLSGSRPFDGGTAYELAAAVLTNPPIPLPSRVPARLRALVARCLATQPSDRFSSATELGAALDDL
jgi:serine/threonine protein kinase